MRKQFLELGTVVGTHGVRGEMRVNPMCDKPEFAKQFKTVYTDAAGSCPLRVTSCRPHGNLILMRLEGIDSIDSAEKLRGTVLYIKRDDANLTEGSWFIEELIGCEVFDNVSGVRYGVLKEVVPMPANDIWTVKGGDGKEYMLPAIKQVINLVDVDAGIIKISPMRGIFDEPVDGDGDEN